MHGGTVGLGWALLKWRGLDLAIRLQVRGDALVIKFIHTADWHLGLGFPARARGEELRKARLETVRNVIDLARAENADFVLVAGDAFESNRVSKELIAAVKSLLEGSACPVLLLPGNHDPLEGDSVYTVREGFRSPGGVVQVLAEPRPVRIQGATIYPCPCMAAVSSHDPTSWIPPRVKEDGIRIGVAHGAWQVLPELLKDDHPIPLDAQARAELDYLALGHWHSAYPDPDKGQKGQTFYPGTHEPMGFEDRDAGNAFVVTIEGPGQTPSVQKKKVSRLRWLCSTYEIRDSVSLRAMMSELERLDNPGNTLIKLVLEGVIVASLLPEKTAAVSQTRKQFAEVVCDEENLRIVSEEQGLRRLPSILLSRVVKRLLGGAEDDEAAAAVEQLPRAAATEPIMGDSPAIRKRALELLFGLLDRYGEGADR